MIVADTNILVYLTLPSDLTATAEALLQKDPQWAAPILWRSEFCNALAFYLRKKLLTVDEAYEAFCEAEGVIGGREFEIDSLNVLRLAAVSGQTSYDCEFVTLAQSLGVSLITADKKLFAAFPHVAVPLAAATT